MAGLENWETCVSFCSFCFPCCYCQASPRVRVYGSTFVAKKIHFTSKKPTHTYNIQCVPRQKVNHKHLLSQGIFIQQPVFEEKQEYQTNFICERFYYFIQRNIDNALLNFHDWLHFWKHLRHFC